MSLDHVLSLPDFSDRLRVNGHLPFAYEITDAKPEGIDLSKAFCCTIGGAARSGKTNMLKVFMRLAKEQDRKVYVFDGASRELETYANDIVADGYMTTADELFAFMHNTMIPEFSRRNEKKAEFIKNGRKNADEYFSSMQKIFVFIHDMSALCEAVYEREVDMKGFMEQMIAKGDGHLIYFFACVSQNDMTGKYNTKHLMRGFISWKEGLHLGGKLDDQKVFDFDIPVMERMKPLPPGYGHAMLNGVTKRIVTPVIQ
jgi:S-DNA-T family DNA segregation ATPase FtsK/SpoIIIE